jgi:hypothetical protein
VTNQNLTGIFYVRYRNRGPWTLPAISGTHADHVGGQRTTPRAHQWAPEGVAEGWATDSTVILANSLALLVALIRGSPHLGVNMGKGGPTTSTRNQRNEIGGGYDEEKRTLGKMGTAIGQKADGSLCCLSKQFTG